MGDELNTVANLLENNTKHVYMVAYIYGMEKKEFGSLILEEDVDTATCTAQEAANFHTYLTNEISDFQGVRITILNLVRLH